MNSQRMKAMRLKKLFYLVGNGTAQMELPKDTILIIDEIDLDLCSNIGWALKEWSGRQYAHGSIGKHGDRKTVMIHTLLIKPPKGYTVDHINGNGLDNRRCNLRIASPQQNSSNRRKIKVKTSKYKGVHKRENGKWRAAIRVNRKLINLGTFILELDAVNAYNKAATQYFGEFACLNILL